MKKIKLKNNEYFYISDCKSCPCGVRVNDDENAIRCNIKYMAKGINTETLAVCPLDDSNITEEIFEVCESFVAGYIKRNKAHQIVCDPAGKEEDKYIFGGKYWDGMNWANSDSTYEQANKIDEIILLHFGIVFK